MSYLLVVAEAIVENTQPATIIQTVYRVDWLSYIVPVVVVLVSFFAGSLQNRNNYKKQQLQLRYDDFYVPYIKKLYDRAMYANAFSLIQDGDKDKFIDLAFDNFQHLDLNSQEKFLDFMHSYYGDKDNIEAYNKEFDSLNDAITNEAKSLSKKLKIPNFAYIYTSRNLPIKEKRQSVEKDT